MTEKIPEAVVVETEHSYTWAHDAEGQPHTLASAQEYARTMNAACKPEHRCYKVFKLVPVDEPVPVVMPSYLHTFGPFDYSSTTPVFEGNVQSATMVLKRVTGGYEARCYGFPPLQDGVVQIPLKHRELLWAALYDEDRNFVRALDV
jgi:hypothetical protein